MSKPHRLLETVQQQHAGIVAVAHAEAAEGHYASATMLAGAAVTIQALATELGILAEGLDKLREKYGQQGTSEGTEPIAAAPAPAADPAVRDPGAPPGNEAGPQDN